jgi:hypothetical protein
VSFILITAEADVTIPYNNFKKQIDCCYSVLENPRLKKWYSINVDFAHPKLIPIPLGLPKHIPFIVDENDKKSQYMGWVINFTIDKVSEKIKSKGIHMKTNFTCRDKKLLYSRMTLENSDNCFHDREGIRREAVDVLRSKSIEVDTSLKPYDVYLDELIHHKFCLSLPGKGMDCYRTWEALTVGVIPIVLRTRYMDSIYDGLPVLIIDDINQITSDFLNQEFERMTSCIDSFDYKKLTSSYWIDSILQNLF